MKNGMKRTLLAFMVMAMLASSTAVPAMASDGDLGNTPISTFSDGEGNGENGAQTVVLESNGLPAPVNGVITLSSGTYTLTGNVSNPVVIEKGAVVTLNLNGQTISVSGDHAIHNKGTLTINGGNGVIPGTVMNTDSSNQGHGALLNAPGATVTINGGAFSAGKWYTIKNLGNMTIDQTTRTTIGRLRWDCSSSLIDNGWENDNECGYTYSENSSVQLTINGGTFEYGINSVKNSVNANLDIYGGTFCNSDEAAIYNYNTVTIYGGNFSSDSIGQPVLVNSKLYDYDDGEMTILGGTFKAVNTQTIFGYHKDSVGGTLKVSNGTFTTLGMATLFPENDKPPYTPQISGGSFTANPGKYLTNDVEAVVTDEGQSTYEVYGDLQKAVNAAKSGDLVTIQKSGASATINPNSGVQFAVAEGVSNLNLTTPSGQNVQITDNGLVLTWTVSFEGYGSKEYENGSVITIPQAPTALNGFAFIGWSDGSRLWYPGQSYTVTGNVSFEAIYDVVSTPGHDYIPPEKTEPQNGWVQRGSKWYLYDDDEKLTGWQKVGNTWYYMDEKGVMLCDGLTEIDGETYYFYDWGGMASSWWYEDENGDWYYFRGNGAMAKNSWIEWKGKYYYVGSDGKMLTGTTTPDGYYVNWEGVWIP